MKCTICGHKPTGRPSDDCLFELDYYVGVNIHTDNMCRACAYLVSAAAGKEVKRLKELMEAKSCKTA